jgi:hypothetical protein
MLSPINKEPASPQGSWWQAGSRRLEEQIMYNRLYLCYGCLKEADARRGDDDLSDE